MNTETENPRSPDANADGAKLMRIWHRLSPLPLGSLLFSRILGWIIPYTGSMGSVVEQIKPGHSRVRLPDRRRVRNHLNCVHAIALANLAELSTGLAMLSGLPAGYNGILVGIDIRYLKKARGQLIAECICQVPEFRERQEFDVNTEIRDLSGDVVTTATARWLVGPR